MMAQSLKLFHQEGIPIASLYAFRESYYRKFGYEVCGSRVKISVPNNRYPKIQPILPIRRLTLSEVGLLQPCYSSFCHQRSGMNLRTEAHWNRVVGKDTSIYAAGDPIEAYLIVNHQWQFWEGQTISELIWTTERGYDAILSMAASIGINKNSIDWYEPSDGPYISRYFDQGVKANVERLVMYRVIDVPESLRAMRNKHKGEFTLAIDDSILQENSGPWHVSFSADGTRVERTKSAQIRMTIGRFTQALLGEPSLNDMIRNGTVCCENREALHSMELLLPPSPTYCTDFF
jgi:predicted acetyltransferase